MRPTLSELGIDQWSVDDRIALVQELEASIERDRADELPTEAQWMEIQRRIAASDANPGSGTLWEVVRADLWTRIADEAQTRAEETRLKAEQARLEAKQAQLRFDQHH